MSEQQGDKTTNAATTPEAGAPAAAAAPGLTRLMAAGDPGAAAAAAPPPGAPAKVGPDLEAEALRAAEQALAEGQRALAAARAQLAGEPPAAERTRRRRELLLRALLAFNVLAMIAVASLPSPASGRKPAMEPPGAPAPKAVDDQGTAESRFHEPWNKALAAAENRDFATAVAVLDQYLADSPRMAPSQQLSVLMALAHYSARQNDFKRAQEYQRRADAIDRSHSLPEDLVAMAKAAAANGDQESLRRIWARFLLQQRQVPSWLYKHVAEAYLQLGDSYRLQANEAAAAARLKELEEAAAALRRPTEGGQERGK